MLSKEQIEKAVNEQLAQAISEQVFTRLQEHWNQIINELASTRRSNAQLSQRLEQLENQMKTLTTTKEEITDLIRLNKINSQKALEILNSTSKDLGLSE